MTITLEVTLNTVKESNPLTEVVPSPEEFTVAPLNAIIGMDELGRLQKREMGKMEWIQGRLLFKATIEANGIMCI